MGFERLAIREDYREVRAGGREVSVGGNQPTVIHKKARAGKIACKDNNHSRLYSGNYILWRHVYGFPENRCLAGRSSDIRWRQGNKIDMKLVGFEQPEVTMTVMMHIDPLPGTFSQHHLLSDIARKDKANTHRMLETLLKTSESPFEITTWKILLIG